MTYSILAEGLVKRLEDTVALDGIDLAVRTGSVFGLLGPNGAIGRPGSIGWWRCETMRV
jgi:oleandomycin transport system ATP-binding protein